MTGRVKLGTTIAENNGGNMITLEHTTKSGYLSLGPGKQGGRSREVRK